jgi:prepilin-type N-terminal cleavage/methylation domain-containing protein
MKTGIANSNPMIGFTLLELLVVITIIVVLLALLAPAMDRAIYQAELAVCAAGLDATASGMTLYAMDFSRRYPYRKGVDLGFWQTSLIYNGDPRQNSLNDLRFDDRPFLRPYIGLNAALNDPLAGKIDIEGSKPETHIYTPRQLWFGWRYTSNGLREPGMMKLGDRFEWNGQKYNVLASDWDVIDRGNPGSVQSSHPDSDGVLEQRIAQDTDWTVQYGAMIQVTYSAWAVNGTWRRGPSDLNYGFQDGSVRRYDRVTWDDARMAPGVPDWANGAGAPTVYDSVPSE